MPVDQTSRERDALKSIYDAIVATSRERPLSRLEVRIRCLASPRPWLDLGLSYSGWHRRRRKQKQAVQQSFGRGADDEQRDERQAGAA